MAASDLILKLCTSSLERIQCHEIKSHLFFNDVHFDAKVMRRKPAPHIPSLKSPTDTSNFDAINLNRSCDSNELSNENIESPGFIGFTYRRFFTSIEPTNFVESFVNEIKT